MFRIRFLCLLLALLCIAGGALPVRAAEVDCDATYCFSAEDFSSQDALMGICITQLHEANSGTVMLGRRVIRQGDILTADQLAEMTFHPLRTETDRDAIVTYLPIYQNRVERAATMTLSIRGKEDKIPVAKDSAIETYKNLSNEGKLSATDPEGQALSFTVVRQPKRGSVVFKEGGTFVYTPKKNKVGVDSFTFTATDPAGNVSREATVTIQILKPTSAQQYTDTAGRSCRFAAEWMRNTGLFVGEQIGDEICFNPDKAVSRGEFLAMMAEVLDVPITQVSYDTLPKDTPHWLKPYLAAAIRSGLTDGLPQTQTGSFEADQPITGACAAVLLQNALDLPVSQQALETMQTEEADSSVPAWASVSLTAMAENDVLLSANDNLTRSDVSQVLYQVSHLANTAPGVSVLRKNK
jgi:hypothetical protein